MSLFRDGSKPALFLELARPDDKGFSRSVRVAEFIGRYASLQMGNGGDWCRDDGSLGKKFNIRRVKQGNRIVEIQLQGFNIKEVINKTIPGVIRDKLECQRCVVLGVSSVEIDHKDGHRDDPRSTNKLTTEDFQPLSKAANNAKRQHCKDCRATGNRFDARKLGYTICAVHGNGKYEVTRVGCYWHYPFYFNQQVSKEKE